MLWSQYAVRQAAEARPKRGQLTAQQDGLCYMPDMRGMLDPGIRAFGAGGVGRIKEKITGVAVAGGAVRTAGPTSQKRGLLIHIAVPDRMRMGVGTERPTDPVELTEHILICIAIHRTSSLAGDARLLEVRISWERRDKCQYCPKKEKKKVPFLMKGQERAVWFSGATRKGIDRRRVR